MTGAALFVAGTDTDVGKTAVAAALCRALRGRGLRVGVFKPAETGCADPERPADALALVAASGCRGSLDTICPYRLREPLAPAVAAGREGVTVDPDLLGARLAELRTGHDLVVCEGAGGLMVPLAPDLLTVDWLAAQNLPVLLVGRLGLGTLNHCLLSVECLRRRGVPLLGTVLSATVPGGDLASRTNPEVLGGYPEACLLGVLEHGPEPRLPARVLAAAQGLLRPPAGPPR